MLDEEIKRIESRIAELKKSEETKKNKAEEFVKEARDNALLKEMGVKVSFENRSRHIFIKVMLTLIFISLIGLGSWFGWLGYEGKFTPHTFNNFTIISPINNSVQINNDYEFNPEINNEYKIINNNTNYINNILP